MNRERAAPGRHRRPCHRANPRRLRSRHFPQDASRAVPGNVRLERLPDGTLDWPRLWAQVERELRACRYAPGTLLHYRQVLRSFRTYVRTTPPSNPRAASIGSEQPAPGARLPGSRNHEPGTPSSQLDGFLCSLGRQHRSWSWIAANISVLRTAFDKLGGLSLTSNRRTPRRPQRLPEVLTPEEARRVLAAGATLRDQLLLGLLYGCGLKPGEAAGLKWSDVDLAGGTLRVRYARGTRERRVALPEDLRPVLREGVARCPPESPLFPGGRPGQPLRTRTIERLVRAATAAAGLGRRCSAMTLRHSYAAHCLARQANIRALQETLGHARVETTLLYTRLTPPAVQSPIDRLRQATPGPTGAPVPLPVAQPPTEPLFEKPLSVEPLELPFPGGESGLLAQALRFYRLLRTHVREGFLALRRAARTG